MAGKFNKNLTFSLKKQFTPAKKNKHMEQQVSTTFLSIFRLNCRRWNRFQAE
jgi:hypothetical protein